MAITVWEGINSRAQEWGANASATLEYFTAGTADEAAADAAVRAQLTTYRGLWPTSLRLEQHSRSAGDGLPIFRVVVAYGPVPIGLSASGADDVEPSYSADFFTEMAKIQQGLAVVNSYYDASRAAGPCNFLGAINVTREGVEGVEVEVPAQQFSLTASIPTALLTKAYRATVSRLTRSINSNAWYGFQPKEVKFLGMTANGIFGERSTLTYRFAASPNVSGLVIGNMTNITKAGWDYLWCYYEDEEDEAAKMVVKRPLFVNVNQVSPLANFLELGLGS